MYQRESTIDTFYFTKIKKTQTYTNPRFNIFQSKSTSMDPRSTFNHSTQILERASLNRRFSNYQKTSMANASHGRPISRQLPKEKWAKLAANRVETPAASSTDALENETRG